MTQKKKPEEKQVVPILQPGETYANWKILGQGPKKPGSGARQYLAECPTCHEPRLMMRTQMARQTGCSKCPNAKTKKAFRFF